MTWGPLYVRVRVRVQMPTDAPTEKTWSSISIPTPEATLLSLTELGPG